MRNVVEQPEVAEAVDEALERWPRAYDAWEAVTWVVARDPFIGKALTEGGNTRALTLEGAKSIGLPTITIVYEIGETAITIHSVRFENPQAGQAGRA